MTGELDFLVAFVLETARRPGCDEPVPPRPDGEMRDGRLFGNSRQRRIVDGMARYPFVERPDDILTWIAGERRAQGDYRFHPMWMVARKFAPEEAAKAPADNHDRSIMAEAIDPI